MSADSMSVRDHPPNRRGVLFAFFFQDTAYRWKTYWIAASAVFLWGAFNEIALEHTEADIMPAVVTLGMLVLGLSLLIRALKHRPNTASFPRFYKLALGFATCVAGFAFLVANIHDFSWTAKDVAAQDHLTKAVYDVERGKLQAATNATLKAKTLIAAAAQSNTTADPEFFVAASHSASQLHDKGGHLAEDAFDLQEQLAVYKSKLAQVDMGNLSNYSLVQCNSQRQEWLPPIPNMQVIGMVIKGCQQNIDGVRWQNVIFVNSRIIYRGGPLALNKVLFVNCTFSVERNDYGFQLLQYATTLNGHLKIPPNPSG